MPRFVVLRHETPPGYERPTHWDFMLECGDVLRTWALAEPPLLGRSIAAEELPNHRLAYLDYEGEVSRGRGSVTRWDAGTYELLGGRLGLSPGGKTETFALRLAMHSEKLSGEVLLTPVQSPPDRGADASPWPGGDAVDHAASPPRYWSFNWKGT